MYYSPLNDKLDKAIKPILKIVYKLLKNDSTFLKLYKTKLDYLMNVDPNTGEILHMPGVSWEDMGKKNVVDGEPEYSWVVKIMLSNIHDSNKTNLETSIYNAIASNDSKNNEAIANQIYNTLIASLSYEVLLSKLAKTLVTKFSQGRNYRGSWDMYTFRLNNDAKSSISEKSEVIQVNNFGCNQLATIKFDSTATPMSGGKSSTEQTWSVCIQVLDELQFNFQKVYGIKLPKTFSVAAKSHSTGKKEYEGLITDILDLYDVIIEAISYIPE